MQSKITVRKEGDQSRQSRPKVISTEQHKDEEQTQLDNSWEVDQFAEIQREKRIDDPTQQHLQPPTRERENQYSSPYMKISEINSRMKRYTILAKVVESFEYKMYRRNIPYVKVKLADESGCADGFFKGQNCYFFKVGNIVQIKQGQICVIKGHISLEFSLEGRITINSTAVIKENTENNISAPFIQSRMRDRSLRGRFREERPPPYHESRNEPSRREPEPYRDRREPEPYREKREPEPYRDRGQRYQRYPEHRHPNDCDRKFPESRYGRQIEEKIPVYERRRGDMGYNEPPKYSRGKQPNPSDTHQPRRRYDEERPANSTYNSRPQYGARQLNPHNYRPTNYDRNYERTEYRRSSSKGKMNFRGEERRETYYKKICQIKPSQQAYSLVAIITKITRQDRFKNLTLDDETGSIIGSLPTNLRLNYDEIFEGNVIVIFGVKAAMIKGKIQVVFGEYSRISKARFNIGMYKNLWRTFRQ